ncbi:MAG TPA: M43 family zinc metalloprotease [Flavobacteriales bacterium]|nr:M43 family zinc metalloprotease [Flavobacteriales bacterium]
MKKCLLAAATFFTVINVSSQTVINEKCATMPSVEFRKKNDPSVQKRWDESYASKKQLRSTANYDTTGYVVIPVVFHVVYNPSNPSENIDDTLIFSQIDVLNRDHNKTHPYVASTLAVFDSISAVTGIQFKLATVDPMGNPTTGIERISSTTSHLLAPFTNSVKTAAGGGADPWPSSQYLNIWTCEMAFGAVLGYAQFPGDDPATDGVVLHWNYVGEKIGAPTAPSNLGRTMTHEGGHWLGMRHVWGDGDCSMDDNIWDTPDSDAASSQDCMLTRNDCTDAGNMFWGGYDPVDNVQNYMDYSSDACMTMFTRQQVNRMWHYMLEFRDSLFHSGGCGTPALNGYVITQNISCPASCDGMATVVPVVGTAPFQYLWNDPMAQTNDTATGLCHGTYTVRVIDADNDTIWINAFVTTHNTMFATAAVSDATVCGQFGTIVANAVGGMAPYTYTLDTVSQSSNTFSNIPVGSYYLSVMDSCGTVFDQTVIIDSVDLTATTVITNDACGNCGAINVNASGGNGGYTYALDSLAPQSSDIFSGLAAGTYTVTVYDTCGNTETLTVVIENTIGLAEIEMEKSLNVYPNPASHMLTIELGGPGFESIKSIAILDEIGRPAYISTGQLTGTKQLVPVTDLANGMYVVKLQSVMGQTMLRKFIKSGQ